MGRNNERELAEFCTVAAYELNDSAYESRLYLSVRLSHVGGNMLYHASPE